MTVTNTSQNIDLSSSVILYKVSIAGTACLKCAYVVPRWLDRYNDQAAGWTTEAPWFDFWQKQEVFGCLKLSRPALVPRLFSGWGPEREADYSPPCSFEVKREWNAAFMLGIETTGCLQHQEVLRSSLFPVAPGSACNTLLRPHACHSRRQSCRTIAADRNFQFVDKMLSFCVSRRILAVVGVMLSQRCCVVGRVLTDVSKDRSDVFDRGKLCSWQLVSWGYPDLDPCIPHHTVLFIILF